MRLSLHHRRHPDDRPGRCRGSHRLAALALLGALTVTSALIPAVARAADGAAVAVGSPAGMLAALNATRAANGLAPYVQDPALAAVALAWAEHMATDGVLGHNPGLRTQVTGWVWVGENVGYGPSWQAIESAYLSSPPHRANILDTHYTQVGIAVVTDASGLVWTVQDFRQPAGGSPSSAPPPITRPKAQPAAAASPAPASPAPASPAATPVSASLANLLRRANRAIPAASNGDPITEALRFASAMRIIGT
ncbi:MAG: CAP domain-containing protein [Actinomycetes bacterium]